MLIVLVLYTIGGDIPICTAEKNQMFPRVAWSGENFLVVWEDERDTLSGIWGQLISNDGTLIGSNFPIGTLSGLLWGVSFGDSNYLVVGGSLYGQLYGQFVSPSGELVGTTFLITEGACRACIAWGGKSYLIAWSKETGEWGRLFSSHGVPLSDSFMISPRDDTIALIDVCSNGNTYLVLLNKNGEDVLGRIISSQGMPLDTIFQISYGPICEWPGGVASDGENYLVVWDDGRAEGATAWDIYGQIVSENGELIGPEIPISTANNDQRFCDVASGGMDYLVVWVDARSTPYWPIYGQFVSKEGALIDTNFMVTSNPPGIGGHQMHPTACAGGDGYLVVWTEISDRTYAWDIYGNLVSFVGIEEGKHPSSSSISLLQSFPNPFYRETEIRFILNKDSNVTLTILNILGQKIKEINLGHKLKGFHSVKVSTKKEGICGGVYFYQIKADGCILIQKMVVLH